MKTAVTTGQLAAIRSAFPEMTDAAIAAHFVVTEATK